MTDLTNIVQITDLASIVQMTNLANIEMTDMTNIAK